MRILAINLGEDHVAFRAAVRCLREEAQHVVDHTVSGSYSYSVTDYDTALIGLGPNFGDAKLRFYALKAAINLPYTLFGVPLGAFPIEKVWQSVSPEEFKMARPDRERIDATVLSWRDDNWLVPAFHDQGYEKWWDPTPWVPWPEVSAKMEVDEYLADHSFEAKKIAAARWTVEFPPNNHWSHIRVTAARLNRYYGSGGGMTDLARMEAAAKQLEELTHAPNTVLHDQFLAARRLPVERR